MSETHHSRVAKGMGWLLGASFATRLLSAGTMLVLTRLLVPEDFGLVALATTMLGIASVVTEMQLANALIQMRRIRPRHFNTAFTLAILRSGVVVAALLVGGYVLSILYKDPRLILLTAFLCLDPLAMGLRSPKFAVFDKELRFGYSATLETSGRLIAFLASVVVAIVTRSYWAIVVGQVASSVLISAGSYVAAPYRPRFSLVSWRQILGFSVWLNFIGIVSTLSSRLDNFFVAGFLNKAILGQYVVGNQLSMLVSEGLLQPLQRALFPGFAKLSADRDALRHMFRRSQAALISIGIPFGLTVAVVATPAVHLFIGPEWPVTAQVMEFIGPIFGIQLIFGPVNAIALALGETRALFFRSLWNLFLRVPAILLGLHFGGILGLLIARTLSGGVFLWIADATLVSRMLNLSVAEQIAPSTRSLLSGLVLAAVGITCRTLVPTPGRWWGLVVYIGWVGAACCLSYLLAHYVLWRLTGRPDGVERDVGTLLRSLLKRKPIAA